MSFHRNCRSSTFAFAAVFPSKEAEPSELPLEDRQRVLDGDVSLNGIARLIREGRASNIVVVCGALSYT